MAGISQFVDKNYEYKDFKELADSPLDTLQGLSEGGAKVSKEALGIDTVRELAEHKFVRAAQATTILTR